MTIDTQITLIETGLMIAVDLVLVGIFLGAWWVFA